MSSSTPAPLSRRLCLGMLSAVGAVGYLGYTRAQAVSAVGHASAAAGAAPAVPRLELTDAQWKARLSPAQYQVLRQAGTERAGTSALNNEKRKGRYLCVACDHPLFTSDMKFDSGTGWPSFFTTLPSAFKTSTDYKLLYPRTEYHCARCDGHHGHVFKDGPAPTRQRWCNNGVALKFEVTA
jgi:peptide-methionine (R)-S-oxide reductase